MLSTYNISVFVKHICNLNKSKPIMEILTLSGLIIGYLSKRLAENKEFKSFTSEFTNATIDWIKPLFLKGDGKETEILNDLKSDPKDLMFQEAAKLRLATFVKKNPDFSDSLNNLASEIRKKEGALTSGYSINQTHLGSGDNIGRDKIVKNNKI